MDSLVQLQKWYLSQCNDDWEHGYGVRIETLDNPGWSFDIDLVGTSLEGKHFEITHYGMFEAAETSGDEWIICKVEGGKFAARGGPLKLDEMLTIFLRWADAAA
ncbi:immunity 53 family protein [Arenimonas sp.]|uniref:immunity 53 family protein n=1 Tax=Arenimonas sp. TaxID=1872635 RepID=UPI002E361E73|nr:immunity 53 family protein [Arenimonas sp.]HEX4854251.1 immunity 53 family protein [Arenimonas sp.]